MAAPLTPLEGVACLSSPPVLPEENIASNLVEPEPGLIGTPIITGTYNSTVAELTLEKNS